MKEIINGKLYAAETATFLAAYDNGYYVGHPFSVSMALFRKSDGE